MQLLCWGDRCFNKLIVLKGKNVMKNKIGVAALLLFIAGCATIAPKYNTDFNHISPLRKEKLNPVRVAPVTKDPTAKVDSLTIRGSSYLSPYGSYADYLAEALKQELDDAQLLNPNSQIEVSAVLLRNSLDAGISIGVAEVEARFVVRKAGELKYEKVKIAKLTWESSFVGDIAVPLAEQNYLKVMQKLIGLLLSDPEFISALR